MQKMFPTLPLCILPLLFSLHTTAEADKTNRFNVLFIAIDDLRPELGCYGVAGAQSPHLDRLAAQGILFTRHYVQVPTCGASRYALLTGRSPARSGVTHNNAALYSGASALKATLQPGAQSMPELFRRSGYRTTLIGKISHTADGRVFAYNGRGDGRPEMPHAWDTYATPLGSWKRGWGIFFAYADGKHREDGGGHRDLMQFTVPTDQDLPDGLLADAAIAKLKAISRQKAPKDERFFIGLGFFKPHLPFVAPQADWDAFEGAEIDLPPTGKIDSPHWHSSGEFYKYRAPFEKSKPLQVDGQRQARRAYRACVRYVDRQVGRVLEALEELELAKSTIVVVWGDHGWHLGEQQIWGKHSPFERALRSALILKVPGAAAGQHSEALVESIDLYPTLVAACQPAFIRTEWPLDGQNLMPILEKKSLKVRDVATSYWRSAVSLRTESHRLIYDRSEKRPTELYDLRKDADSMQNLAEQQPELVRQLQLSAEQ